MCVAAHSDHHMCRVVVALLIRNYWEMLTPIPLLNHASHEHVEGDDYSSGEEEPGHEEKMADAHHHYVPAVGHHTEGCSVPLYLCPRRLTRSSHIGASWLQLVTSHHSLVTSFAPTRVLHPFACCCDAT